MQRLSMKTHNKGIEITDKLSLNLNYSDCKYQGPGMIHSG